MKVDDKMDTNDYDFPYQVIEQIDCHGHRHLLMVSVFSHNSVGSRAKIFQVLKDNMPCKQPGCQHEGRYIVDGEDDGLMNGGQCFSVFVQLAVVLRVLLFALHELTYTPLACMLPCRPAALPPCCCQWKQHSS